MSRRRLLAFGGAAALEALLVACRRVVSLPDGGAPVIASSSPSSKVSAMGDAGSWASGGTASMTAKASYPNPFTAAATPNACAMMCELQQGPCWDSKAEERQDISDGLAGLPTRLQLRVLDESCKPIVGAVVDVWHVSPVGKYSGNDYAHENVAFCTENEPDFKSHKYFRGKQTSDANGVVTFDSCFPGWYHGRAIHVHAMITVSGEAFLTTQLCFDDALNAEIISTQPIYSARGMLDTTDEHDGVFPAREFSKFLFQTSKMSDGAMLAWKTLILRSSLSEAVCGSSGPPEHPHSPPPNGNQRAPRLP
jgi:protocatechuate 3,4-dioxygenase beta subunit